MLIITQRNQISNQIYTTIVIYLKANF